jgi:hypothetical protein
MFTSRAAKELMRIFAPKPKTKQRGKQKKVRPCKIYYLLLRYRCVGKKSAAGLCLSPNKNKYNGKKVCVQIFAPFSLN